MTILVTGTSSGCGKNTVACGLIRLMRESGQFPIPMKPLTIESLPDAAGLDITPSVVLQCIAAGVPPDVIMNPLRAVFADDRSCSIFLNGERRTDGSNCLESFLDHTGSALSKLKQRGTVVMEGSGALAESFDSPALLQFYKHEVSSVVLVADAFNGGALAAAVGTLELAPHQLRERIRAIVINRFAGFPWEGPIPEWRELLRNKYGIQLMFPLPIMHGLWAMSEDQWPMASTREIEEEISEFAATLDLRAGPDFVKLLTV